MLCFESAVPPGGKREVGENPPDLTNVPLEYHDLPPVFSKQSTVALPPHRPYGCTIGMLPRAKLPRSSLYSLSRPERDAMETYLRESLAAGLIRPSSSPLGAGAFFVKKKDGSLRPCIDYWGLNRIMVRNKYTLPLLNTAFELLQGAHIFTKLDLRNAYHLVQLGKGTSGRRGLTPTWGTISIWSCRSGSQMPPRCSRPLSTMC